MTNTITATQVLEMLSKVEKLGIHYDVYEDAGGHTIHSPKHSSWKCYLFGNRPDVNTGIVYTPQEGRVPNRFVRFMMRICFDCLWVNEK